jgi:hypothetical protein
LRTLRVEALAAGKDPMAEKKAKRKAAISKTAALEVVNPLREVSLNWVKQWKASKDKRHVLYIEGRLNDDIISRLGDRPIDDRPIDEIQPPEIVEMILAIEARGAEDVARRARALGNLRLGFTKNVHRVEGCSC